MVVNSPLVRDPGCFLGGKRWHWGPGPRLAEKETHLSPKFLLKPSLKLAASLPLKIDDWKTILSTENGSFSWDIVKFQGGYMSCSHS